MRAEARSAALLIACLAGVAQASAGVTLEDPGAAHDAQTGAEARTSTSGEQQQVGSSATVPAQSDQQSSGQPAPAGTEGTDATVIGADSGDIIVTATRNSTLASKTPVSLTAITGSALLSAGVTNPTNLGDQVPSLSIDRANAGLQITIRGVTSSDTTEKGDPSTAFMVNGIYIARPQEQEVSFFDVDRVEVLRGPQGTLFGRNTTAGLVNVITNQPVDQFEASVDAGYGSYDTRQVEAMINVPLSSTIAVRAAGSYDYRDSYYNRGPLFTSKLDPYKNNVAGRLSASWDGGPAKLLLVGDYSHLGGRQVDSVLLSNFYRNYDTIGVNPLYSPMGSKKDQRTIFAPITNRIGKDNTIYGVLADFSYDFGKVQLNYLGSYRKFIRNDDLAFALGSGTAVFPVRGDTGSRQISQEVRLSGTFGPLAVQAGGYYFNEKAYSLAYFSGLLNPTPGAIGYIFGFPQRDVRAKSVAGFGQATLSFTDRFRVTGGVRYSRDDKSRVGATVICGSVACTEPGSSVTTNNARRVFSKVTWRVGVDYDLNSRSLLYGVISTGYKAGGFNDGCEIGTGTGCTLSARALYYDPETLTSYEVGIKTRIADTFRINASVFHYDYNGIQLSQVSTICGGPCQVTTNAGKAKVDGVEVESVINPGPNTRFDISGSWTNARYSEFFPVPGISFAGTKLDRAPEWSFTTGVSQTIPLANAGNIQLTARSRFSSKFFFTSIASLYQFEQPSFTRTDVTVTYNAPGDRWYIQAFGRNLEDSVVITGAGSGTFASATLADPRTYGVRAGMRF